MSTVMALAQAARTNLCAATLEGLSLALLRGAKTQPEPNLVESLALGALFGIVANRIGSGAVNTSEIEYLGSQLAPVLDRLAERGLGVPPELLASELASVRDLM